MEKDTSNPFHYMNESKIEIQNASSVIENEYGIYQEFCDTGKNYFDIKLHSTYEETYSLILIFSIFLPKVF